MNEMNAADWFKLAHETATEQVKPWRRALFVTNALWCSVVITLIYLAYCNPVEVGQKQSQDMSKTTQSQEYSSKGNK